LVDAHVSSGHCSRRYAAKLVFYGVLEIIGCDLELRDVLNNQRQGGILVATDECAVLADYLCH